MIRYCAYEKCRRPFKTQWHEKFYCCKDCRHKARKKRDREHRRMHMEVMNNVGRR
ncbi:MAG: hypothetical protein IKE46_03845 [Selenomonadaceae bacterium]|nr:hypothetical protein [Selenomonadaceae bacterium]